MASDNPFDKVKARLQERTGGTYNIKSYSATNQRIDNISKQYSSIFADVSKHTVNLQSSIDAEISAQNKALKKQMRQQAALGLISSLNSTLPQVASAISAITAAKKASANVPVQSRNNEFVQNPVDENAPQDTISQEKYEDYVLKIGEYRQQVKENDKTIADYGTQMLEQQAIIDENTPLLNQKQREIDYVNDEMHCYDDQYKRDYSRVSQELSSLMNNQTDLEAQIASATDATVKEQLNKKLDSISDEIEKKEEEMRKIDEEYKENMLSLKNKKSDLVKEKEQLDVEIQSATEKKSEIKNQNDALVAENNKMKANLRQDEVFLETYKKRLDEKNGVKSEPPAPKDDEQ